MTNGRILVVGEHVGERWELAWALHEAGIAAEQVGSAAQAKARLTQGRVAGIVVSEEAAGAADDIANDLRPDPDTGELPFVLVATRATTPSAVVARVHSLIRAGQADAASASAGQTTQAT